MIFCLNDKGNTNMFTPSLPVGWPLTSPAAGVRRVTGSVTVAAPLPVWTSSKPTSDNLLQTQLDGRRIGFLWLSVQLKYHYRGTERRETRDKEEKIEANTHSQRERERERDKAEYGAQWSASGIKQWLELGQHNVTHRCCGLGFSRVAVWKLTLQIASF